MKLKIFISLLIFQLAAISLMAQTTAFTYQGRLSDTAAPASASYDFQFSLFDAVSGGTQLGTTQTVTNVAVANGIFTVTLDFGSQFTGADRFLDISVKKTTDATFTPLIPRQPITSSPHAIKSLNAASADGLSAACVGCVANSHIQSLDGGKLTGVITGNGSGITNINGVNISGGTVGVDQLAPNVVDGPRRNLTLIGTLRWDLLKPQATFVVGNNPQGVAFDGANIWVANQNSNNVTKLRASDGANLGTFAVGVLPRSVAFDGANIWVTNQNSRTVTKLRASDGANLGSFSVGFGPEGIAFDGANIWVANSNSNNVMKLRASDGALQGTFPVGNFPLGIAFDGANIWVTNTNSGNVTKLRASDGANLGSFTVGTQPFAIAFDGANLWVVNRANNNVTKLRASDGANLGAFTVGTGVGNSPVCVAFDGANVWVGNREINSVTKLRASDGANLGTFAVGVAPVSIAFDGTNVWVANNGSNNVTRLFPTVP